MIARQKMQVVNVGERVPVIRGQHPAPSQVQGLNWAWVVFLVAHLPLALLMYGLPALATLHAIATLALGLWWAGTGRRPERVAYVGAYITGAEVIWRMAQAQLFWEFGKYATAAICVVTILRARKLKRPALPFLYFVLLLPSAVLPMANLDSATLQSYLSFNLSGPLALMLSAWFFSRLQLSTAHLRQLFLVLIGPVLGIASITLFATLTASAIDFGTASNLVTSGGFGPNQVSAILGLGVLLAFLCLLDDKISWGFRGLMLGSMIFFAVQSALTFSRGGLFNVAGSATLASLYLIREARSRVKLVLVTALLLMIVGFILLPRLDAFTGGALLTRFQDTRLTGRDRFVQVELHVWAENPIFGVGPGRATPYRAYSAHTEFSRLLAEHGVFGLSALILLLIIAAQSLRRARTNTGKALVVAMLGWSFLFMLSAAMRLVAPAFIFGLASATISQTESLGPSPLDRHKEAGPQEF